MITKQKAKKIRNTRTGIVRFTLQLQRPLLQGDAHPPPRRGNLHGRTRHALPHDDSGRHPYLRRSCPPTTESPLRSTCHQQRQLCTPSKRCGHANAWHIPHHLIASRKRLHPRHIRGLSGCERKRLTICEATLSGIALQCWDNSTRGLDSANAIDFCRNLRLGADLFGTDLFGTAAAVSIYQAPQSAYDMFDKATVLYESRQIFFGAASKAKDYFEGLGFDCPPRQTTPDFLTSMTSPGERVRCIRPGWEGRVPRTSDEFVSRWRASPQFETLQQEMEQCKREHPLDGPDARAFRESKHAQQARTQRLKSPFMLSYLQQIKLCLWRGWRRPKGDPSLTVGAVIGNFVIALIVGSVFYNLQETTSSFFQRGALVFFACLLSAFSAALEVCLFFFFLPLPSCNKLVLTD